MCPMFYINIEPGSKFLYIETIKLYFRGVVLHRIAIANVKRRRNRRRLTFVRPG